jgi:peptidoglycan/LPS O-acetylase OafA/YrhL
MRTDSFSRPDRMAYLDSLRGLAALGVAIFYHYQHFSAKFQPGGLPEDSAPLRNIPLIMLGYDYGEYCVDFFFVLSGIVFSYVYWDKLAQKTIGWREYIVARFARLYPIQVLTLMVLAPLVWLFHYYAGRFPIYNGNTLLSFIVNLLFLQSGFFHYAGGFNEPAWSLSVEAFCYCIFFAMARWNSPGVAFVAMFFTGFSILAMQLKFGFLLNEAIARGLVGFAIGMILYRTVYSSDHGWLTFTVAGLAAVALLIPVKLWGLHELAYPFAALVFAAGIVIVCRSPQLQRVLEHKVFLILGDISLATYMIHIPLQVLI